MEGIKATIYIRPHGASVQKVIMEVYDEDAKWFRENEIEVSLESDGVGGFIVYAHYGEYDEDGEPLEALEFSARRSCKDTLKALRHQVERLRGDCD